MNTDVYQRRISPLNAIGSSRGKSVALFAERGVTKVGNAFLKGDEYGAWLQHAIGVQTAIYDLDLYYETSESITSHGQSPLWDAVVDRLQQCDEVANSVAWQSFDDLKRYGQTEARIHSFDTIDPREFSRIAAWKCSDVRIARALIWSYGGRRMNSKLISYWQSYDRCWELIEDSVDIQEDGRDWNFNFWLYAFQSGQPLEYGFECADAALRKSLEELDHAHKKLSFADFSLTSEEFERTVTAATKVLHWRRWHRPFRTSQVLRFSDLLNRDSVAA